MILEYGPDSVRTAAGSSELSTGTAPHRTAGTAATCPTATNPHCFKLYSQISSCISKTEWPSG